MSSLLSSLGDLPPGRSKCPTIPFFSMLCLSLSFQYLPLPLFPSILPSVISLCRELSLRMCPIQFFCLVLIISIKDLFSSVFFSTSSFVLCSVQLILSILLHIHISKGSIRLKASFLIVHVSAPYSVTLHISALTILFLMSLFNPPFNNSFLLVNASFPSAILLMSHF